MENLNKSWQKLKFSISINASKERVWDTMLEDKTYREWTSIFHKGSYFKGNWEKGSQIQFLGPEGGGMIAKIAENRPYDFISIEYIGFMKDGEEDVESEGAGSMSGAHEDYTFKEENGVTKVLVELDIIPEYRSMMEETWPIALDKLKEIVER